MSDATRPWWRPRPLESEAQALRAILWGTIVNWILAAIYTLGGIEDALYRSNPYTLIFGFGFLILALLSLKGATEFRFVIAASLFAIMQLLELSRKPFYLIFNLFDLLVFVGLWHGMRGVKALRGIRR